MNYMPGTGQFAALEAELLADLKELAEHNMLADLGRNGLERISRFGSAPVEKHLSIEKFSPVMHVGSTLITILSKRPCKTPGEGNS
jgi:anthranilate synthase component 1